MKVTATEAAKPGKPEYPYFGKSSSTGAVVLFTEPETGACIVQGSGTSHSIGRMSIGWAEHLFTPFYGTITVEP